MSRAQRAYKVLDEIQIDYLAGCPIPTQEGAVNVLMKRHDPDGEKIEKDSEGRLWKGDTPGILTSAENGHTHIVWLHGAAGETTMQRDNDPEDGSHHDHPWVLSANGSVEIGANLDHTHTVDAADVTTALVAAMNKAHPTTGKLPVRKEIDMPDDKTLKALEKRLEKAEARAEKAESRADLQAILGGLTPTQKSHFDALEDSAKPAFAAKSSTERDAELGRIQKAKDDADPTVYTSTDGLVKVRKSDGDLVLMLAKRSDEDRERAEKAEGQVAGERLSKMAREFGSLPGDEAKMVRTLKAIETIPEGEDRDAAMAQLRAGNEAIAKAYTTTGVLPASAVEGSPQGDLDKLTKAHAAQHNVSEAVAMTKVLKTTEGKRLYAESVTH
jgi:hypothetical protein